MYQNHKTVKNAKYRITFILAVLPVSLFRTQIILYALHSFDGNTPIFELSGTMCLFELGFLAISSNHYSEPLTSQKNK